jgi:hypothetical protein
MDADVPRRRLSRRLLVDEAKAAQPPILVFAPSRGA